MTLRQTIKDILKENPSMNQAQVVRRVWTITKDFNINPDSITRSLRYINGKENKKTKASKEALQDSK